MTTLTEKYEILLTSISKILSCLEANPVNDPERESLKFLKKFIKGLDTSQKVRTKSFVKFQFYYGPFDCHNSLIRKLLKANGSTNYFLS